MFKHPFFWGSIVGIIAGLAAGGTLRIEIKPFIPYLDAPLGFYSLAASSVYTIVMPFRRFITKKPIRRKRTKNLIEGLEGLAWTLTFVGFAILLMTMFGVQMTIWKITLDFPT